MSNTPRTHLPGADDTIAAVATAPGRSALAVVRLSGARAYEVAARALTPWRAVPRATYLASLRHPETGAVVDRAVVTVYAAPASYTGEDVVELSVHGGAVVPALALDALLAAGARVALPGEFTRRAVANAKMDVLQAEAVGDLIDARSRAMHETALRQLDGGLSRRVTALRDAVLELEALIAYDIDFPEEDEGPVAPERVAAAAAAVLRSLDDLLATADTGELIRDGAVVVIAGAPNTGKSSLFNALLGYARAIVTEVPGTTRDALEAVIDIGRWPARLVDTAGMRETEDVVERLGIEVSERWLARADVVLACGDDAPSLAEAARRTRALTSAPVIPVRTKGDRGGTWDAGGGTRGAPPEVHDRTSHAVGHHHTAAEDSQSSPSASRVPPPASQVVVSAHTGAGLRKLTERIQDVLAAEHTPRAADVPLLTRERHRRAVALARAEVAEFERAWRDGAVPATIAAVHLRAATASLEELVGAIDVEDVLDRLFSSFCVGK